MHEDSDPPRNVAERDPAAVRETRNVPYQRGQAKGTYRDASNQTWIVRSPFPNRKTRRRIAKELSVRMNKLRRYALQGSQSALEKLILIGQMVNSTAETIEVLDNWGMLMEDISEEEREALGMGQSDGGTGPAAPVRPEAAEAPPEPPKSLSQHWFTEVPERDEA